MFNHLTEYLENRLRDLAVKLENTNEPMEYIKIAGLMAEYNNQLIRMRGL